MIMSVSWYVPVRLYKPSPIQTHLRTTVNVCTVDTLEYIPHLIPTITEEFWGGCKKNIYKKQNDILNTLIDYVSNINIKMNIFS